MNDILMIIAVLALVLVVGIRIGFRLAAANQDTDDMVDAELVSIEADRGEDR